MDGSSIGAASVQARHLPVGSVLVACVAVVFQVLSLLFFVVVLVFSFCFFYLFCFFYYFSSHLSLFGLVHAAP